MSFALSADSQEVIYAADHDVNESFRAYRVSIANPGIATSLGPELSHSAADIAQFIVPNPTGTDVLFRDDRELDNEFNLYHVDMAMPEVATRVNDDLTLNGDINADFQLSDDGDWALYRVDQRFDNVQELYLKDLTSSAPAVRISPTLPGGGNVESGYVFTPDGLGVVFRMDYEFNNKWELFYVALADPGTLVELTPIENQEDVLGFRLDGVGNVYFVADLDTNDVFELYMFDLAAPETITKLSAPLQANRDVNGNRFEVSADGSRVVYVADNDVDNLQTLYAVDTGDPEDATEVGPTVVAGGDHVQTKVADDGSFVVFRVDAEVNEQFELYAYDFGGGGFEKLHQDSVVNGDVFDFYIVGAAGDQVFFRADHRFNDRFEAFLVDIGDGGNEAAVPEDNANFEDVLGIGASGDGSRLFMIADFDQNDFWEMFYAEAATPDTATAFSRPLPNNNFDIREFAGVRSTTDGSRVFHTGDLNGNEIFECYASEPGNPDVSIDVGPQSNGHRVVDLSAF